MVGASKQANIHTHVRNAVKLVWGSLSLAPISSVAYSNNDCEASPCICEWHGLLLSNLVVPYETTRITGAATVYMGFVVRDNFLTSHAV